MAMSRGRIGFYKEHYPRGTRVQLDSMSDDPRPVALFEFAIESQNGRGDPKALALNIIKGFFAVNLFSNVPVQLYGLAVSLQSSMSADMTGV